MDFAVESKFYTELGAATVGAIGTADTRILVYVEINEDSFATVIRYLDKDACHLLGAFSTPEISGALNNLRSHLLHQGSEKLWTSMEYLIEYGEINVTLSYDKRDVRIPIWERTPAIIEKHFPGIPFKPD